MLFAFLLCIFFVLFVVGLCGLLVCKTNLLKALIFLELMLVGINGMFILFSLLHDDLVGQIAAFFILSVAAAESGIGLGLVISFFRINGTISLQNRFNLKH